MPADDTGNFMTLTFVPLRREMPKASVVPKTVPAGVLASAYCSDTPPTVAVRSPFLKSHWPNGSHWLWASSVMPEHAAQAHKTKFLIAFIFMAVADDGFNWRV